MFIARKTSSVWPARRFLLFSLFCNLGVTSLGYFGLRTVELVSKSFPIFTWYYDCLAVHTLGRSTDC